MRGSLYALNNTSRVYFKVKKFFLKLYKKYSVNLSY